MSRLRPNFVENESEDGILPSCPYCGVAYRDAAIFDVKNYPDDGRGALFLECEECEKEAEIVFQWTVLRTGEDRQEEAPE